MGHHPFPIRKTVDEDGEVLEDTDPLQFQYGRAGDHLMLGFQCETCHFRNIYKRNPIPGNMEEEDTLFLIRRATLDAFWSRATSTVKGNLKEGLRAQKFADTKGTQLVPDMGPFPIEDSWGMMVAITILNRSLDPGINEEFVQWDTFRGTRSFVTNASQAGVKGLKDSVAAYERKKMWMTDMPTHTFWFHRFMEGLHKRVGQLKKQDEVITIEVMKSMEEILDREWAAASTLGAQRLVADMGAWMLGGFCGGIRGEEMVLIELAGTTRDLEFLNDSETPHFIFVISGRTKGNQLSGAKFGIPIVGTTEGTHLEPGKWVKCLCDVMKEQGLTKGRLFRRSLNPTRLYEFEHDFYKLLKEVQRTTPHIKDDVDVVDAYGILRSLRKGMTAHGLNMGVRREYLNAMNRWSTEMNSASRAPRLDMVDTYASLHAIKPLFLRITRKF